MINYGIMQGRLMPCFKFQYQAHPVGYWQEEFELAKKLNLKYIEFIVDSYLYTFNPITNKKGVKEIQKIVNSTGVKVNSICADIFMQWPIKKMDPREANHYGAILETLIINLAKLGGSDIVIPFVDNSSLKNNEDFNLVTSFLEDFDQLCFKSNINLSLETDLKPPVFCDFLSRIKNRKVRVNYDSGNSASLGYKFEEEIKLYGEKISNIHIKDRRFKSGPVTLGDGDAELKKVKNFLVSKNYDGIVIFQAFRDDNQIETFEKQYLYFLEL